MKNIGFAELPPADWENVSRVFAILREFVTLEEWGQVRRRMATHICDSLGVQRPGIAKFFITILQCFGIMMRVCQTATQADASPILPITGNE